MEIIGAGFGRTGTTSLKVALERLGFGPCEHMFDVTRDPDRVRLWLGIADGEPADWSQVFCGYRATVDWPGAAYWRELTEAFPLAKVVLTVRDPDRWFDSAVQTIFKFPTRCHSRLQRAVFAAMSRLNPSSVAVPRMLQAVVVSRVFRGQTLDGGDGDREFATRLFREHIEAVKASVPAGRLLVFDVAEGWQPLCAFLGVPVPDGPFPRANDLDTFRRRLTGQLRQAVLPKAAVLAAGVAALAAAITAVAGAGAAAIVLAAVGGAALPAAMFATIFVLIGRTERRRVRRSLRPAPAERAAAGTAP
jgi:sulfotransferase family protein